MYAFYFSPASTPQQATPDVHATVQGLAKALEVKPEIRDSIYIDWKMTNGNTVPLTSKQIILGTTDINGLGKYGNFTTDDIGKIDITFLTPLANAIKRYYEGLGFVQSIGNTSQTPNDLWAIRLGYEKDGLYCISNLAQMSDPFAYLSCGTIDTDQQVKQKELKSVYQEALAKDAGTDVSIIFRVNAISGDFANGSVSSIGGYQWIAKKTDGIWKTVWSGNDMPLCSEMEKISIPEAMYPGCYDPDTQTTITSPGYIQN